MTDRAQDDPPADELIARVLDEHLLAGPLPGQCRCGWGDGSDVRTLGQSHSKHVAGQLSAALAGRTVVTLPDQTSDGQWLDGAVRLAESADDEPVMYHEPYVWLAVDLDQEPPDDAEQYGLALVAAARASRRIWSESVTQKGDDTP